MLFRRACLERHGYWPEHVANAGDWRHWIAIIEGGRRQNFAYLATPTCLHFSADWKHSRHSAVEEVRTWLEIADGCAWWPEVLRYRIPTGIREQHVIAAAMRDGGEGWVGGLRAALHLVLDRVAWDDIRTVRPRLRARDLEVQQLRAHVGDLEQAVQRFEAGTSEAMAAGEAARLDRARTQTELETTRAQLHAYQERLSHTLASTSWRVTAPIRTLRNLVTAGTRKAR